MSLSTSMSAMLDELEYVNHVKKEMALHMLQTGRRDLVPHALQMLPNTDKVNTTNNAGLTPLQMAALRGDTNVVSKGNQLFWSKKQTHITISYNR